jgi:hypothetical protein
MNGRPAAPTVRADLAESVMEAGSIFPALGQEQQWLDKT